MATQFSSKLGRSTGLVLGKFMPPHAGHVFLCDVARRFVDELYILVCSIEAEPIDGVLRYHWMRELFPDCRVIHISDEIPQAPEEHPDFWPIWQRTIRRTVATAVDYVFTSEDYGGQLAEILDAVHIPVDPSRSVVPISATMVRAAPLRHWDVIPAPVRPYYVKRVCLMGAESTGKSTLCARLAAHFETSYAPEFARPLLAAKGGRCDSEDIALIARGQRAVAASGARRANRVLFCDTNLLTTAVWSRFLFGDCPRWIEDAARDDRYDLCFLLDEDLPWADDGQRHFPDQRGDFTRQCVDALARFKQPYRRIGGPWQARFDQICTAVNVVLSEK